MRFTPKHPELRRLVALAAAGLLAGAAPSALAFPFSTVQNTQDSEDVPETENITPAFTFGLGFPSAFDPVFLAFTYLDVVATFSSPASRMSFVDVEPSEVDRIEIAGKARSTVINDPDGPGGTPAVLLPDDAATYELEFTYEGAGVGWNAAGGFFFVNSPNDTPAGTGSGSLRYIGESPVTDDLSYTPGFDESTCEGVPGSSGGVDCDILIEIDPSIPAGEFAFLAFTDEGSGLDGGEGEPACFFADEDACDPTSRAVILGGLIRGDCDPADDPLDVCDGFYNSDPKALLVAYPDRPGARGSFVGNPAALVPEPGALALGALGVFSIAAFRRRRRWS